MLIVGNSDRQFDIPSHAQVNFNILCEEFLQLNDFCDDPDYPRGDNRLAIITMIISIKTPIGELITVLSRMLIHKKLIHSILTQYD